MFTRSDFDRLAAVSDQACLTIYLPTHRAGQETHNGHDRLAFKDALREARKRLASETELSEQKRDDLLARVEAVADGADFWRHQSDSLAVFAAGDEVATFKLPVPLERAAVHVGNRFTLTTAARMLAPGARWYVFAVTQNDNRFYECTRHSVTPIYIRDKVPANLEEVLEIYEGGEQLQHHSTSVPGAGPGTVFQGQGSNEDRQDEWLEIYFRRIGNGVTELIAGQEEPLVIACDPQHVKGIKSFIDYPHIVEASVRTHPSTLDPVAVQRDSWQIVQPMFDKAFDELQEKFATASGGGNLVNGLSDVVPAAVGGRVAALYVAEGARPRFGHYEADTHSVRFVGPDAAKGPADDGDRDDEVTGQTRTATNATAAVVDAPSASTSIADGTDASYTADDTATLTRPDGTIDLLEEAIRQTVANGGPVLFRLADQVPDASDGVTGILRYDY